MALLFKSLLLDQNVGEAGAADWFQVGKALSIAEMTQQTEQSIRVFI